MQSAGVKKNQPTSAGAPAGPAQAAGNRQVLCWQGWRIVVPRLWNPVKLEGDFNSGYALLVDMQRPRLALRWSSSTRMKKDPQAWINRLMRDEVGQLAAAEAKAHPMPSSWSVSQLYVEPEPPGRDVWFGCSSVSGRVLQVVHHAYRREHVLAQVLLPSLVDESQCDGRPWSVLDLSCRVDRSMQLVKPLLYAGDLGLKFAGQQKKQVIIRQIAPASVALKRLSLERWLRRLQADERKHYRPGQSCAPVEIELPSGRKLEGWRAALPRRRRFFWKMHLPHEMQSLALHDHQRDRLVLIQGGGVDLTALAQSVGWADGG